MITIKHSNAGMVEVNDIAEAEEDIATCLFNSSLFKDFTIYDDDLNKYEIKCIIKITSTDEKVIL
jgi:hypothetical protein